ncbi:SprT family zinc-dependent metalloprotease [Halobacteriovorax sp. RZ-3]|uniref:M48 family metallopeptidase n=1 Tax=Halobacteriovorax sp. RZ-3 TaxID=3157720 RepID=UPI00371CB1B5
MESIDLGNRRVDYSLKRSKRKTLGITVNSKGQVIVTAPDYIPMDKIEEVIQKRKNWIIEKVQEKESNLQIQPRRKFVSGESVYLFGRQYYLKIIKSNDYHIEMGHNRITFYVKDLDEAEAKVTEYLDNEFRSLIEYKTTECLEVFSGRYPALIEPVFKVRKMAKRWGSCTKDGIINLNPVLVAASVECIEYVIFHELTHLLHDDHDDEFFMTLKRVCPKYKELKEKLEKETVLFEV